MKGGKGRERVIQYYCNLNNFKYKKQFRIQGADKIAEFVTCLLTMTVVLILTLSSKGLVVITLRFERQKYQGHPQLYREFKIKKCYRRSCQKKKRKISFALPIISFNIKVCWVQIFIKVIRFQIKHWPVYIINSV